MRKIYILFLLASFALTVTAQGPKEDYNIQGDDAFKNLDYDAAKSWYDVGISKCDQYSVSQMTKVWFAVDGTERNLLRDIMGRCLNCLDNQVKNDNKDTVSIALLITYYKEGIGANKNDEMAMVWQQRLDGIRNPNRGGQNGQIGNYLPREKARMQFFVGYSANFLAPVGLTVGGVGQSVGWYLRFRTNLSFADFTQEYESDTQTIIGGLNNGMSLPHKMSGKKVNSLIATGGIMIKIDPSVYLSVGVGYCSREELYQFQSIGVVDSNPEGEFWAKKNATSYSGVAFDVDGSFRIGKSLYGSIGVSVLNLKYVYPNVGIGLFF